MKQMAKKTKKQKLDVVMGILLQLYLFLPWIVTEKGHASIHQYLLWIWNQKDPVQVYHRAFLKDMTEPPENAETIAVWFLTAALILLGIQIGELVHLFLSVRGKRYPYLQPLGWLVMFIITGMLFQIGVMNISLADEQMVFLVPTEVCAYLSGFLALDGVWYLAGKAAEQWDEASRRAKEEQERKKWYRKERKKRLRFPGRYSYLYYEILWKSFRHRWRDFSFVFLAVFLVALFLFTGISMQSVFADSYGEDQGLLGLGLVEIMRDFLIVLLLISFFLLLGVLTFYRRKRAADNGIFHTLGIRSSAGTAAWIGELMAGFSLALAAGLITGRLILKIFCAVMEKVFPLFGKLSTPEGTDYLWTVVAILVISLFAFGFSHDIESARQTVDGRAAAVKSEKLPGRYRLPGLLAGLFLSGYSIYRYSQRRTVESMLVLCLFFIGLYMICHNGWGIALQRRKRNLTKYLDSLPGQHMVLHRFQTTVRYLVLLTVIHVSVMFYFSMKLISNQIAEAPEDRCPYDYVLFANSQDGRFLQDFEDDCSAEVLAFPMIRATTMDTTEEPDKPATISFHQGQNIGISESTYRKLKELAGETPKKQLGLDAEGRNIYVVYQQDQGAKAKPIDWYMMTKEPYLHIGQPLVAYNAYEYRTYYPMRYIVGEETSSLIGCFRQGRYENLIVFSDTYFEKVKDYWKTTDMNTGEPVEPDEAVLENTIHEGPTVLALINLPESAVREQEERADQIMAEFQKAHAYDESFDPLVKSAYSKKEAVTRRQMEHILETVMNGFVLVMLLTAGILMLHMKINMELPEIKTRYQFMECFGMRRAERVRNMKKEVSRFVWIPLGTGTVISMVFTGIVWRLRDFQTDDIRRYVLWQGLIWMIYAIIQIGNMKWLQRMVIKEKQK